MQVTCVSFVCDSVGGFDWFWNREYALIHFEACSKDQDYSEIWLFTYDTDSTDADEITEEIDDQLTTLEDGAERYLEIRERRL